MGEAKKKQIVCPAVNRRIKPSECGENRISRYDCPANCEHNPWNPENYDRALEINDRFTEKMISRLRAESTAQFGYAKSPPFNEDTDEFEILDWFANQFYRETDAEGKTFIQRWEERRFEGLNNDQRVMLAAESKMRPCLVEVQEVRDHQSVLAVDLLDPDREAFVLLDRSLASRACRFSTFFMMIYDLPHYSRAHSAGCPMPEVGGMSMLAVFMETVRHLGGSSDSDALTVWLAENLVRVVHALMAVTTARNEAAMRGMDIAYTTSVYELKCSVKKLRDVLKKQSDVELEELSEEDAAEGFVAEWEYLSGQTPFGADMLVGRVLLHEDGYIQLEASSAARTEQLKDKLLDLFGDMLQFSRERTDDLAAQLIENRAYAYDAALVPETLLQNSADMATSTSKIEIPDGITSQEQLEQHLQQQFLKTFRDEKIPLLDHLTPRQAAQDPTMRPRLIELMKSHVRTHDEENLRKGWTSNINWLLEELGLDEINVPPPPQRMLPDEDPEEYDEYEDEFDEAPDVPLLITEEQLAEREADLKEYKPTHLVRCFREGFPDVHEMLIEMVQELELNDAENDLCALAARIAFQQLNPEPSLNERFDMELLGDSLADAMDFLREGDMKGYLDSLSQPAIANLIFERLSVLLRGGKNHPEFGNCFVFLVSFSEALDDVVFQCFEDLLEHLRQNGPLD